MYLNTIHYKYQMPRILAFDIGIKNLAWCILEKTESSYVILEWDNYNLLSDSSNITTTSTKQKCPSCSAKAAYESDKIQTCSRHCPSYSNANNLDVSLSKQVLILNSS